MTDRSDFAPLNRPRREMLAHVEAILHRHPKLQPLLEEGGSLELACDDDAIWVVASRPGEAELPQARVETPRWWLPPRSGRALAIAEELATTLVAAIERPS